MIPGFSNLAQKLGRGHRITGAIFVLLLALAGALVTHKQVASFTPPKTETNKEEIVRPFTKYKPKKGETLDDIRIKFGVSAETIIWSNHLKGRAFFTGKEKIILPPTSGVVYVPQKGETFASISKKFGISEEKLVYWNRNQLKAGKKIIIPGAHYPKHPITAEKNKAGLPARNLKQIKGMRVWRNSPPFAAGWCTTWVFEIGGFVPWRGNAKYWPERAKEKHWKLSKTPKIGAMYAEPWYSPYGHISLLVATNTDGSFIVSEMPTFGLGNPSYRIVPKRDPRAIFIYYPSKR